jgi:hypothetical protein
LLLQKKGEAAEKEQATAKEMELYAGGRSKGSPHNKADTAAFLALWGAS